MAVMVISFGASVLDLPDKIFILLDSFCSLGHFVDHHLAILYLQMDHSHNFI